jgi:hypothetical protein
MPRYGQFDHLATAPAPVLGWYDTDVITYPSLPAMLDLLEVTDPTFWDNRLTGYWGVTSGAFVDITPVPPSPTLLQQSAIAALIAGIVLTSIATPALDGTYANDPGTVPQINGIVANIAAGLGLPSGTSTFLWLDTSNAGHAFTANDFKNFAAAISGYNYTLSLIVGGAILALPDFNITIA